MEEQKSGEDDDIDVDHYFLPGGILDTPSQREEDMIGGSLLDEIGGVGNVLLPSTQSKVSRIVGSTDPESHATGREQELRDHEPRRRQPSRPVGDGRPIRLSMEGTNPLAKEFTPSMGPIAPEVAIDVQSGLSAHPARSQSHVSGAPRSTRAFSAAVGSEVKNNAVEQPHHAILQRQAQKLARPMSVAPPVQHHAQGGLGGRGKDVRQQQGWASRASHGQSPARPSVAAHTSSPVSMKHRPLLSVHEGRGAALQGLAGRGGIQQQGDRGHAQGQSILPSQWHRRERGAAGKYDGGNAGRNVEASRELDDRVPQAKTGGTSNTMIQPQRNRRNQGAFRHLQLPGHGDARNRNGKTTGSLTASGAGIGTHDGSTCGVVSSDQNMGGTKSSVDFSADERDNSSRRSLAHRGNGAQDSESKVSSRSVEVLSEDVVQPGDGCSISSEDGDGSIPVSVDQRSILGQPSQGSPSTAGHPGQRSQEMMRSETEAVIATASNVDPSPGRWSSHNVDRGVHQMKAVDDSTGTLQPHAHKDKDRARARKKDEKACKSGSKQLLGPGTKESNRSRNVTHPSVRQRLGELRSSALDGVRGVFTAVSRVTTFYVSRLRVFRRLLTLLSVTGCSAVSLMSMIMTTASWLLLMGLRIHSLALKEVTGSVHVAVCFLFPYFFQYLVSMVDEWAPHWLPACLWYSFLMQMFCTSNNLYQHSISSHLVPALRALLPVAFLCEVPSGRSYLLALGGSELLLLSFTLAALRLRCLFSPVFLLSWCSQVFAIVTFGSSSSLQYCQLLVSLASLHAVSMVDITLNSRFYHARYRAGMSLTSGFRAISPASAHQIQ